jgi:hypothetical protein
MSLENPAKKEVPPLSYSSMSEILGCEQKYAYRKVLKCEPDEDYSEQTDAMDLGKVLHKCLELCKHDLNGFKYPQLITEIEEYESLSPDTHGPLIWSMLRRYKHLHESVGLKPLHIELELTSKKEYTGFVDLVLEEEKGIWITDIKTAAWASKFLPSRLSRDPQLNLYVHYYNKIMKPQKPILGCRYRVCTKTKLKRKKDESLKAYANRIYDSINSIEYVIPIEAMNPEEIVETTFKKARARQKALYKDGVATKNFGYCDSYFRPCQFWSKCHGKQYSEDFGVEERVF